jgi:hypothetical protein
MKPFLTDHESLARFRDKPGMIREKAFEDFGRLTCEDVETLAATPPDFPAKSLEEWKRALAEEWLNAASQMLTPPACPPELSNISPFGNGNVPLKEIPLENTAVAVFPLDGSGTSAQRPAEGHVWWTGDRDEPYRILSAIGAGNVHSGDSDSLASALARRAAQQTSTDPVTAAARRALASRWIISGEAGYDGRVYNVKLGNKLDLETNRDWLLPAMAKGNVRQGFRGHVRYTTHLDTAWEIVTGRGIPEGGELSWPAEPVLHSFVSGAVKPVIAMVLAAQPRRVELWHTDNKVISIDPANLIRDVLSIKFPELEVNLREIASSRITEIESDLRAGLSEDLALGNPVLFNATQGHRWMAYALHNVARLNENLWQLYRNQDAAPWKFEVLIHDGIPPSSYALSLEDAPEDVNSEEIFKNRFQNEPKDAENLIKALFK